MFGDILSDLTGEIAGSLGIAPSINSSDTHAMAQASHGSAPDIAYIPQPGLLKTLFLSIVALIGGVLSLALVSSVASWLPPLLGLSPDNNSVQLGWDLTFSVLGGIAGVSFATYYAPCWPRSHGFSIWSLIALGCGYAMWTAGADFPFWFVIALLASLPLQLLAGWWFGRRASRDAG